MATCKSCSAPIIWAVTAKGKPMPIDTEPVRDGNVLIYRVGDTEEIRAQVVKRDPDQDEFDGLEEYHVSHFVTCPQSKGWRRRAS